MGNRYPVPLYILVGVLIGMAFTVTVLKLGNNGISQVTQLKTECEAKLPRDQECHMIFVPNQK